LGASGEARAHLAPGEFGAATPAALDPRQSVKRARILHEPGAANQPPQSQPGGL